MARGPKSDKIWADAVSRAVKRRLENEEGKPQKIERLADKLVDLALAGDIPALKEVGDRLDGRPAQAVDVSANVDVSDPVKDLFASIAAQGRRVTDE